MASRQRRLLASQEFLLEGVPGLLHHGELPGPPLADARLVVALAVGIDRGLTRLGEWGDSALRHT